MAEAEAGKGGDASKSKGAAAYLKTKPAILKMIVIVLTAFCTLMVPIDVSTSQSQLASALLVDQHYDAAMQWPTFAFLITCVFHVLIVVHNIKFGDKLYNLDKLKMTIKSGVVEYCVTMFCCYHTVLSTTAYVSYDPYDDSFSIQRSMVIAFGYILAGLMVADAYFNKDKMPETIKYVLTPRGPSKVALCFLLPILLIFKVISGYRCAMDIGCDLGRVTSFTLIIIFMLMQVIIFLVHVTGVRAIKPIIDKYLDQVDFICSSVGFILFLQITVVTGVYIKCWTYDYNECRVRLVGVLMALITAVVFAIDFVIIKRIILEKSPKPNGTGAAGANS